MNFSYFDTNVFDFLLNKKNVNDDDLPKLRRAIADRSVVVLPNILNIEETLCALRSQRPAIALPQLDLMFSLVDWDYFVKPQSTMVPDDIRHFAWNGEPASPFLDHELTDNIRVSTRKILDGEMSIEDGMFDEVVAQKTKFANGIEDAYAETLEKVQDLRDSGQLPEFTQYFEISAPHFASELAKQVGRANECESRGVASLLKIRSVRGTVGIAMSMIYRRSFEDKKFKRPYGTCRDLQHVSMAAGAADIFVTEDRELAELLRRVPIANLRVLRLREFLDEIS